VGKRISLGRHGPRSRLPIGIILGVQRGGEPAFWKSNMFSSFVFNEALVQVGGFLQFWKSLTDCWFFVIRVIYDE